MQGLPGNETETAGHPMKNDDTGPDFEICPGDDGYYSVRVHPRVWHRRFAAAAMQGLLASEAQGDGLCPAREQGETFPMAVARKSIEYADALAAMEAES